MEIHHFLARFRSLHVSPPLLWSLAATAVVALAVQLTRLGVDVLVIVVLCAVVVALERTIGDWMGELLGAGWSAIILAATVAVPIWFLFSEGGPADRFFRAAEGAGYQTLYFEPSSAAPSPDQAPASGAPAGAAGTSGATAGSSGLPREAAAAPSTTSGTTSAPASFFGARKPAVVPTMRLEAPEMGVTGSRSIIRAHVKADGEPLAGVSVEFTVNGRALETAVTDGNGVATAVFVAQVPRLYQIRAQLTGSGSFRKTSAAATMHILPARS